MKKKLLLTLLLIFLGFTWLAPIGMTIGSEFYPASNYDRTYSFGFEQGSSRSTYRLYTSVPPSLYDYYHSKSHTVTGERNYSQFVTPAPVKTLADNIRNMTQNKPSSDEEFANNVLALINQIPYSVSNFKYPIETLVDNSGDCDVLSFLAASIMKAGSLDVVLLVYRDLPTIHMNVGVHLPHTPVLEGSEIGATGFEYNNKTYWVAECTPSGNNKVGNQPECFGNLTPTIIPLENPEESAPAHVSSNLNSPLISSAISANLSLDNFTSKKEIPLLISGSISPRYSGEKIVMYVTQDGGYSYKTYQTVSDALGNYSFTYNFTSTGTYRIRTSLIGFPGYAGSDSEALTVFVGPEPTLIIENMSEPNGVFDLTENAGRSPFSSRSASEFLKNRSAGTNVSLSGEFIILNTGQNMTDSVQTMTIPGMTRTIIRFRKPKLVITIPERTIKVQNEQENNQFGFLLENNDGNYSASVKLLDVSDLSNIENRLDGSNATFMNVSATIEKNIWYKAVAKITGDEITTELHSANGTLLKTFAGKGDVIDISKFGILISCDPSNFIAFKNLKVESLDQPPNQLVSINPPPMNELVSFPPCIMPLILLVIACFSFYFIKKDKLSKN